MLPNIALQPASDAGTVWPTHPAGVMIAFGVAAVKRFEWITVVFAAILLVSSYKLLVETEDEDHDLSQNTLVR